MVHLKCNLRQLKVLKQFMNSSKYVAIHSRLHYVQYFKVVFIRFANMTHLDGSTIKTITQVYISTQRFKNIYELFKCVAIHSKVHYVYFKVMSIRSANLTHLDDNLHHHFNLQICPRSYGIYPPSVTLYLFITFIVSEPTSDCCYIQDVPVRHNKQYNKD